MSILTLYMPFQLSLIATINDILEAKEMRWLMPGPGESAQPTPNAPGIMHTNAYRIHGL